MKRGRPKRGSEPPSAAVRDEIYRLWGGGTTLRRLGPLVGCSDRTVSRVLEDAGLTGSYRHPAYRRAARAIERELIDG